MGNQADRAWSYSNPVQVVFGENAFASLTDKIAGRPYCLVTYSDAAIFAQLEESLAKTAGPAAVVIQTSSPIQATLLWAPHVGCSARRRYANQNKTGIAKYCS